jgi:diguanylate cyclase (GGDEF)-like protein/PAS domain S-box-containing protein
MEMSVDIQRYRLLYEEIPAVCLMLDDQLIIREINRFGCEQLGYRSAELLDEPIRLLCLADECEFLEQKLRECIRELDGARRWECMRVRKDGSRFWVRDTVRVVEGVSGQLHVLISSEDITETRYLINELERQSSVDGLTGLFSRRKFDRYLQELVLSVQSEEGSHVLFYIDLDQFKVVNDSCGHLCGDELLRQIAKLLRHQIRGKDILARLGGDEFGLILESCSVEEAIKVGQKILHALEQFHFTWDGMAFSVGASIGGVVIEGPCCKASTLMHQADTACYTAKDKGRNRIQMYDTGDREMALRGRLQKWVSRLHSALEQDRFVLYRQQILPLSSSAEQSDHYEVLIRLRGEGNEVIPPGAFIPAAEYYNLSPRIDRWVTQTVLKRYAASNQQKPVTYFINLSGLTLGDETFIQDISSQLRRVLGNGLRICFEITETAAIRNLSTAIAFMERFRALGCQFALDDFGSGFSSFGYLKTLPVDYIKIDGGFVKNMIDDPLDFAVVRAINEVAEAFGKRTIAEYVETGAVLNVLKGLGIDYAQGYHIERPAPLAEEDQ